MSIKPTRQKRNLNQLENDIKCGEITFSNNTKFCFSCTFCKKSCEKANDFYRHVLYDHLNYLEEYQFNEEDDEFILADMDDSNNAIVEKSKTIDVTLKDTKPIKKSFNFDTHFEEFLTQDSLHMSDVSVKSEAEDENEDEDVDYKEDIEEFEFLLENDTPSRSEVKEDKSSNCVDNLKDMLHIEFLEEASENEYEPEYELENLETIEEYNVKNESEEDYADDNNENSDEDQEITLNKDLVESDEDEPLKGFRIVGDETKENNFKCPYPECRKTFLTKGGAKRHVYNFHKSNKKVVTCKTCFKTFNNQATHDKHNMLRHLGFKPHECEICGQGFSDKSNLNVHVMRHKGIKPHVCNLCQKRFHSSTELKLHMRSHTGERPFVCEVCGRKFSSSGHLCNHRRRHFGEKPYQCDVCQKKFFDRKLLNDHKVMHTDERPFECVTCGATFQRKKALLQHEKLHSTTKEYVCKICGKSFAQNAGLYSHMKSH